MKPLSLKISLVMAALSLSVASVMAETPCHSLGQGESAEKSDNVIARFQAWSVFVETNPDACFAAANPLKTTIEPATALENLCRGALGLTVSYWPEEGVNGQLAFQSGYEFDPSVTVEFIIDEKSYPLITEAGGKVAWPDNASEDRKLVSAMKRGSQVTITGRSSSGFNVKDTYTLSGFASAVDLAAQTCSYVLAEMWQ